MLMLFREAATFVGVQWEATVHVYSVPLQLEGEAATFVGVKNDKSL